MNVVILYRLRIYLTWKLDIYGVTTQINGLIGLLN